MKYIDAGSARLYTRQSCVATLKTAYGIGKTKAKKINAFLLNKVNQKQFKTDLVSILFTELGRNIFSKTFIDKKVRFYVSLQLRKKIMNFSYVAYRLFQSLPTKGQRTKANSGTPKRHNPYLALKTNPDVFTSKINEYKRRELFLNGRFDELKAYNKSIRENLRTEKEQKKQKTKLSKQKELKTQHIKNKK